jgi:hypothetical protein
MAAVPTAKIPKTISIGPNGKTAAAPTAQPMKDHLKALRNPGFRDPERRSNIAIPPAKPAAVIAGADI